MTNLSAPNNGARYLVRRWNNERISQSGKPGTYEDVSLAEQNDVKLSGILIDAARDGITAYAETDDARLARLVAASVSTGRAVKLVGNKLVLDDEPTRKAAPAVAYQDPDYVTADGETHESWKIKLTRRATTESITGLI